MLKIATLYKSCWTVYGRFAVTWDSIREGIYPNDLSFTVQHIMVNIYVSVQIHKVSFASFMWAGSSGFYCNWQCIKLKEFLLNIWQKDLTLCITFLTFIQMVNMINDVMTKFSDLSQQVASTPSPSAFYPLFPHLRIHCQCRNKSHSLSLIKMVGIL